MAGPSALSFGARSADMAEGGEATSLPPQKAKSKFSVYQNPTFSAALTARSLQPSNSTFLLILSAFVATAATLLAVTRKEDALFEKLQRMNISDNIARYVARIIRVVVGVIFVAALSAFARALSLHRFRKVPGNHQASNSKKANEQQARLTNRQLGLLGIKWKHDEGIVASDLITEPSKKKPASSLQEPLVPIRTLVSSYTPTRPIRVGAEQQNSNGGKKSSPSQPAASPVSPWLKRSGISGKGIMTEEMLEQFLVDVDRKITESATKSLTPPAGTRSFGAVSPGSVATSGATPGTGRSTPLRPVRMSPGSHQKYTTPPKKGEGELPSPMTMEQMAEALENLGIYPHIEQWRDNLRQWFSSILLNPLLDKIETSHLQVMQAASKVGISITINQIGSDSSATAEPISVSQFDGNREWQPTVTQDEGGLLHQLRTVLLQARDASKGYQMTLQNPLVPLIQSCLDAIVEHQRLHVLMKGELVRGLLPQSNIQADYTAKRVRELSEGTCVKNYEYLTSGEFTDKVNKKWAPDLPTDSHLLAYLFCVFLDHPKWMLHVEPTSYLSTQSSKNPLFLGILPPKDRFPEKYVAVVSSVPTIIHPGACILVIGKQSPPVFALYWDKKLQFSLQGRTALWDAILLLCHRIQVGYGGVVRGIHLGSSAFGILPVLDANTEGRSTLTDGWRCS